MHLVHQTADECWMLIEHMNKLFLRSALLYSEGIHGSHTKSVFLEINRNQLGRNFTGIRWGRWHAPLQTLAPNAKQVQNDGKNLICHQNYTLFHPLPRKG